MPAPLLTFLKYIFLALLYLFFLRVLRAVWIELREPRVVGAEPSEQSVFDAAFAASSRSAPAPDAGSTVTTAAPLLAEHHPAEHYPADHYPADQQPTGHQPVGHHLVVTDPPGRNGVSYPLAGEVTVGRSPGCRIALPDDTFVSQVHARLFRRDGRWWVEDLGSTNGTYVNDVPVTSPVVVGTGDRVQFGQTVTELRP